KSEEDVRGQQTKDKKSSKIMTEISSNAPDFLNCNQFLEIAVLLRGRHQLG
ncbi:MAG: hypothetical protein RLY57_643, partial [Candidatus Parcubacteria bacterium]